MNLEEFRRTHSRQGPPAPVETPILGTIYMRRRVRVPTEGSQRRCYNGCFPDSDWEIVWGAWEVLNSSTPQSSIEFWRDLNKSAVAARGCDANIEYKWEVNP